MIARARSGGGRTGEGVVDRIRGGASGLTEFVRSGARAAKEQAVDTATHLGEVVQEEAGRIINAKRGKAASKIRRAGAAADTAARLLRAGRIEGLAKYVELAGETAEHASDYVKSRDFQSILDDLGEMAKRHPAAVFGGVLATAFAAGRLLKVLQEGEFADEEDEDDDQGDEEESARAEDEYDDAGDEDEEADDVDEEDEDAADEDEEDDEQGEDEEDDDEDLDD